MKTRKPTQKPKHKDLEPKTTKALPDIAELRNAQTGPETSA
ncbi:hypothetical protein CPZ13_10090 [Lacticaseibacillus paracasei]|nr:hypothetical protein LCAZH_0617 [Lacticaseibacillus paracasei]EPC27909.1 hypothetical protein Lpp46_0715 [Lacticaseibacillus paracasei subsp. paracasei Lpp46]MBG1273532.1 hypothetical protein [Lacticaseibacillus paracasei subsp. paracasei]AGP67528.1 Hypothetical protein LOCK919_0786 [Lacticaseibacillus paracasei]AWR90384.1 hypothetical protein DMC16_04155 [Lacticaseibacillus paracasei]